MAKASPATGGGAERGVFLSATDGEAETDISPLRYQPGVYAVCSPTMSVTEELTQRISDALLQLMSQTPGSKYEPSARPDDDARRIAAATAKKSAAVSGTLAIPAGPLGLLTIVPDLVVVWKLQQQMVADIAALYGKSNALNAQTMAYCMFAHSSSSIVTDLVARVGGRSLVRRASLKLIKSTLKRIGVRVTKIVLGKSVSRLIPFVGAAAVAAYAYQDTLKVARSAIELFSRKLELEPAP